jgi:hypothetical protein
MGKGIVLIFYLFMLPITGLLLLIWIVTYLKSKKHFALYILIAVWTIFILGIGLLWITEPYFKPMILTQNDIYGTYVIDKDKFSGKQADWQYDNFKFTITKNDELIFKTLIHDNKWKSETVKVSYSSGYFDLDKNEYCNRKIRIHSDSLNNHIIRDNPTLYRKSFNNFYYVFKSKKFGNVFFKKGDWINKKH